MLTFTKIATTLYVGADLAQTLTRSRSKGGRWVPARSPARATRRGRVKRVPLDDMQAFERVADGLRRAVQEAQDREFWRVMNP
jgi:hypothetical protein